MKIAAIIERGEEKGSSILLLTKGESPTLLKVFETFCADHKNQPKARKMLRELTKNFLCF